MHFWYIVSQRGIEVDPTQIGALIGLESPRTKKEIQALNGRIAALGRFISKSTDRCLPFFKALKGNKSLQWTEECEKSFQKLKEYLASPKLLSKPIQGEKLLLYLAVSENAVSSALVRQDMGVQKPIFYVSRALLDTEKRYPEIEKLAFVLVVSARKLIPYFQAHPIEIPTSYPLKPILRKPEVSGRLVKWSVELGEFDISYVPWISIKGQALADFLAEFTPALQG